MPDVTQEAIMKIAMGFMAAKHLFAASEIGLFETLANGPATVQKIASETDVPPHTVGIVAAAMVSLGLLEREGERYRNGDAAAAFLAGADGLDMRPMLRFWDRISYPLWQNFETAVRTGQGQAQFGQFTEEQQRIFSEGVASFFGPTAAALAAAYDFGGHQRILDVAGGTGSFLIPILRRHDGLTATLFELPGACAVARRHLAETAEGARVEVVEGNFFEDPLPGGHDALILANTVHVLSVEHNVELMQSMRAAVETGARLLLVDLWTDPTHTDPPGAALMSGEFVTISGEGRAYSEQEADEWLSETGWRKLERRPLAGASSLIVAEAT